MEHSTVHRLKRGSEATSRNSRSVLRPCPPPKDDGTMQQVRELLLPPLDCTRLAIGHHMVRCPYMGISHGPMTIYGHNAWSDYHLHQACNWASGKDGECTCSKRVPLKWIHFLMPSGFGFDIRPEPPRVCVQ